MTDEEKIETLQLDVIKLYQEVDLVMNYIDALQRGSPGLGNLKSSSEIRAELAKWHTAIMAKRKESPKAG
jgi:hypothetical protein